MPDQLLMNEPIIVTKTVKNSGPTVAVFAGVHGNERVGIMAIERLLSEIEVKAGVVHFVIANPLAVEKNVRFVEKNLNRRFLEDNQEVSMEDDIARKLMKLLDSCDALLDLHACNEPEIEPFVICEEKSLKMAEIFDVGTVSIGWKDFEAGSTDAYMDRQGKIAIGLECGSVDSPEKYVQFTKDAVVRFLEELGCLARVNTRIKARVQNKIKITGAVSMPEAGIRFKKNYKTFDVIPKGEVFASSGEKEYVFPENGVIIFPRPKSPLGAEACLMGMFLPKDGLNSSAPE